MNHDRILAALPYKAPFLFVEALKHVDDNGAEGYYTFDKGLDFYAGHFKEHPVTPGVILTECCAQIGLVCLGISILGKSQGVGTLAALQIGMSSAEMEFYIPVFPGERVRVVSTKTYFRFHKLKCEVKMYNAQNKLVCKGVLAGMLKTETHG